MDKNTNESLLQELLAAGFETEIAEKAILNAPRKDFESAVNYIERLQQVREEKLRCKQSNSEQNEKIKKEREQMEEYIKQREEQKKKDELYLKNLEEKIEANRIEKQSLEKQNVDSDVIKTKEIQAGKDDCQIKLRMENGSQIIFVNKNETLKALSERITKIFGSKKFEMCDNNHVPILIDTKTLEEAGFYPHKMVLINRK